MVKVSIIVPVYNVERYIRRCLESMMAQETSLYETECVIVNDATPDNSMEVVHEMLTNYRGNVLFTVIEHEFNKGLSMARNTGIDAARGEFLLFVDSDDYLMPGSIEYMVDAMEKHPNTDIVIGNMAILKDGKVGDPYFQPDVLSTGTDARRWVLQFGFYHSAWNRLIRRQFILNHQLYFEPGIIYEDIPWSVMAFKYVSSALVLPKVTYIYFESPSSITRSAKKNYDRLITSFLTAFKLTMDTPYEKQLYVYHRLYAFYSLVNAVYATMEFTPDQDLQDRLFKAKKRLVGDTLRHGRIILALYFLLSFKPFSQVLRLSFFRKHYDSITRLIARLASLTNWLH